MDSPNREKTKARGRPPPRRNVSHRAKTRKNRDSNNPKLREIAGLIFRARCYERRRKRRESVDLEANGKPFEAPDSEMGQKRLRYQQFLAMLGTFIYNYAKENAIDVLLVACTGSVCLVLTQKLNPSHLAERVFPFPGNGGQFPIHLSYPKLDFIVPIWLSVFLPIVLPSTVFFLMQYRLRSFWDMNNAFTGLLHSLILSTIFQVMLKLFIGGLRPNFLSHCDPNPYARPRLKVGYNGMMLSTDACRGDVNFAMTSFPSGHTTAAFAGLVYLFLYLNAKLKVWSNYHPAVWKVFVMYMPILLAVFIGGSVFVDYHHNWYDVVAGAIIGTLSALSAYRLVWASIWDFRYNHIPLRRQIPFNYNDMDIGSTPLSRNTWTLKAGWGPIRQDSLGVIQDELFGTAGAPKSSPGMDPAHAIDEPNKEAYGALGESDARKPDRMPADTAEGRSHSREGGHAPLDNRVSEPSRISHGPAQG